MLDALGSTRWLLSGNTISRGYDYTLDGDSTATGTGPDTRIRFAGGDRTQSGLYHYSHRYYNLSLARWTQRDPLNQSDDYQEANSYTYGGGDPVNMVDPDGYCSVWNCIKKVAKKAGDVAQTAVDIAKKNPLSRCVSAGAVAGVAAGLRWSPIQKLRVRDRGRWRHLRGSLGHRQSSRVTVARKRVDPSQPLVVASQELGTTSAFAAVGVAVLVALSLGRDVGVGEEALQLGVVSGVFGVAFSIVLGLLLRAALRDGVRTSTPHQPAAGGVVAWCLVPTCLVTVGAVAGSAGLLAGVLLGYCATLMLARAHLRSWERRQGFTVVCRRDWLLKSSQPFVLERPRRQVQSRDRPADEPPSTE